MNSTSNIINTESQNEWMKEVLQKWKEIIVA